ncbi:hypothetical protein JCM19000A_22550 [Silvimonas sp. JCM 19000]
MKLAPVVLAVCVLSLIGPAHAQDKLLACNGSGTVSDVQTTNGQEYNNKTHEIDKSTSSNTTVRKPFSGTATVELGDASVRLKLPPALVPVMSDGKDAWYALNDAFIGDKEITGSLKFNLFNKPRIKIDRVNGTLSLSSGFADFNANCALVDQAAGPKF